MEKAALITGGAKRIGKFLALSLARQGYGIALHYHSSRTDAEWVAEEIRGLGQQCVLIQADLSDLTHAEDIIKVAVDAFPTLSLLVNSASVYHPSTLRNLTAERLLSETSTNTFAPILLTQAFAQHLHGEVQGHVVNLLDTKIKSTTNDYMLYTLTKKMLADFTLMAARSLAPKIRINGIAPGAILPPPGQGEAYLTAKGALTPLQIAGTPENVWQALWYLETNTVVTGQTLFVDSGEHLAL